jgi:hypothetical protein
LIAWTAFMRSSPAPRVASAPPPRDGARLLLEPQGQQIFEINPMKNFDTSQGEGSGQPACAPVDRERPAAWAPRSPM